MAVQCPLCVDFSVPTLKFLLVHIGRVHANSPNFKISCGVSGCGATYKNFRCFKDHLKRKHPNQIGQDCWSGNSGSSQQHDQRDGGGSRDTLSE